MATDTEQRGTMKSGVRFEVGAVQVCLEKGLPMASDERLYRMVDGECYFPSVAELLESEGEEELRAARPDGFSLKEWTVHPPEYHLPSAEWITEWLLERHVAEEELSEVTTDAAYKEWESASKLPDVLAAAEALRATWASHITYRMAHEHVATHRLTWGSDGAPLLDGEPVYVPAQSAEVQ